MMKDKRIDARIISMCEVCQYFRDNDLARGNARYFCDHPDGPGGKLTLELITKMQIHKDCPLPKGV